MADRDRVCRYRGCLALCLASESPTRRQIQSILDRHNPEPKEQGAGLRFSALPESEWHITLVTKDELRSMDPMAVQEAAETLATRVFPIGLGGGPGATLASHPGGVYFIVCVWPKAQSFRSKHGLSPKAFHVTLSTVDRHDIDKTSDALLDRRCCLQALERPALEALSRQVLLERNGERALEISTLLCIRFGSQTTKGWVWLADAALLSNYPKLAMLSYAHLIHVMTGTNNDSLEIQGNEGRGSPLWNHCCSQLVVCAASTEWGPVFTSDEIEQVPVELRGELCRPWSIAVWLAVRDFVPPGIARLSYPSREQLVTPLASLGAAVDAVPELYRLPRFFRWIVPFQLAAMSTPRRPEDLRCLSRSLNVRHIVTLTEEEPLPKDWFAGLHNLQNTLLPVRNFCAPSMAQIDLFMKLCCAAVPSQAPVLVHCGGGKGRAGTMVACYLVAFGFRPPPPEFVGGGCLTHFQPAMSASEAIEALRSMRPGSIETEEQERAVREYCSLLWKRQGVFPATPEEPAPSLPAITGRPIQTTDLLVLCGLPGSGKSSFRRALVKCSTAALAATERARARTSNYESWVVVESDELGRKGCERSIGQHNIRRAILDRCNGVRADREQFLNLASTWSQHATAVVFDLPAELCEARALQRADHPTLPPGGRIHHAIKHHAGSFETPTLSEGFQTIVSITSVEAALALVDMLAPPLPLLKFPRTAHLVNLGAATSDDLIAELDTLPSLPVQTGDDSRVVITEKLDGANLGISLDSTGALVVQNRSHVVHADTHRQFRALDDFLATNRGALYTILDRDALFPGRFILYGEWLAATHSIAYSRLGNLFYAFDLFDRETQQFWDRESLGTLLEVAGSASGCIIPLAPVLWTGKQVPDRAELTRMAQQRTSQFYDGPVEGLYVKWEACGRVKERGKVVRGDFLAGDEHWTRRAGGPRFNTVKLS